MHIRAGRKPLRAAHNTASVSLISFFIIAFFAVSGMESEALAAADLTPWLNPAGANNNGNPPPYDISTCASPTVGTACPVTVTVTNLGDEAVTSTGASPVEIQLASGSFNVTESLPDGTVINPGQAVEYTFNTWVPEAGQTDLFVRVNPNGNIGGENPDNNITTLPVIVGTPPPNNPPVLYCEIKDPDDRIKPAKKVTVTVDVANAAGNEINKNNLPESSDGKRRAPVVEISCGSKSADATLQFTSNRCFSGWSGTVELDRKKDVSGSCTIDIVSGDESAYTMDEDSCSDTFEMSNDKNKHKPPKKPKKGKK